MVQLEDSVCKETERICWHMMTTGSSAVLRAILLELCAELRPALERNTARSYALLVPQVMCTLGLNQGIPEGVGQPIGTVPVDPEPSHASRVGIICISAGISNSYNAGQHAIGAIDCTHSAIKAPSHDEFVYKQETFLGMFQ